MFLNELNIVIISSDKTPEKILCGLSLPEDCVLDVHTYSSLDEGGAASLMTGGGTPDCAVILDMTGGENFDKYLKGSRPCMFIAAVRAGNIPEAAFSADDLWVMDGSADEQLFAAYFGRLLSFMKERADSRRTRICFDTGIDSIPDLVWFKDVKGAHLKVNDGFCHAVEKTKEQIYKRGHYYIWDIPKEEYDQGDYVCLESEDIVMNSRKTCLFDEKVKTKSGMRQFKTYKSPLIDSDGSIFGTCGIAHDVTDLVNINSELEIILESIPYGVVIEDMNGNVLSINKEFRKYFSDETVGVDFEEWKQNMFSDSYDISVDVNGQEKILVFMEQAIVDIFGEQIGKLNLFRDVTIERIYEQTTLKNANTDFLTGLHNRRSLFSHLRQIGRKPQVSLITVDLDDFKKVNDNYGHQKGDDALVAAADILKKEFPDDYIARLGGDEFLIVITGSRSEEELLEAGGRLLHAIEERFSADEAFSVVTASAGISYGIVKKGAVHDMEKLLRCSDSALYTAKNSGKARCCISGGNSEAEE